MIASGMILRTAVLFGFALILSSCTGKVEVAEEPSNIDPLAKAQANCVGVGCAACPLPWGGTLAGGSTMDQVFVDNLAECKKSCADSAVQLACNLGVLQYKSASMARFQDLKDKPVYRSCFQRRCDCDHYGTKVDADAMMRFYDPASVTCGTSCKGANLRCLNGVMVPNGETAPNPAVTQLYTSAVCNNTCRTCPLTSGGSLAHDTSTTRFKTASAPCGTTCSEISATASCKDGVLSGTTDFTLYPALTCSNPSSCQTCVAPDGTVLQEGQRVVMYKQSTLPCGSSCALNGNQVTLTCVQGVLANRSLYPTHNSTTCRTECDPVGTVGDKDLGRITGDGGGAPVWMCGLPWGSGSVTHQTKVVAYSRMKVVSPEKCTKYKKLIECNGYRGLWSGGGAYIYPSCKEGN